MGISDSNAVPARLANLDPEQVLASVAQITSSPLFNPSERLCRFLRFIVAETLAGRSDGIKEYVIGVDVYGRSARFDPRADAIVRVEAGRLRAKLTQYYLGEDHGLPVHIALPRGTYVPVLTPVGPAASAGTRARDTVRRWDKRAILAGAGLFMAAAMAVLLLILGFSKEPSQPSIAILPFASVNGADTDRIARGFVEQLTSTLASEIGVRIANRSESDTFSGNLNLRAIGAKLKVDVIVEGSVQSSGEGVRATINLIRVDDGFNLWAQSLESLPGRLSEFQERAANVVARTLRARFLTLKGDWRGPVARNSRAMILYARGHEAWLTQDASGLRESLLHYRDALREDPTFAKAYEGIAASELYLADLERGRAAEHVALAKEAALQGLRLDERLDDAQVRLGNILFRREWKFAEGERYLKRALVLAPGAAPPTRWYSLITRLRNDFSDAQEELEFGLMANPRSEIMSSELGMLHMQAGRLEEARRQAAHAITLDPNYSVSRQLSALLAEGAGRLDEAESEFRSCAGMSELRRYCLAGLGHLLGEGGRTDEAEQIADRLAKAEPPSFMLAAVVFMGLHDKERALSALEHGYDVHDLELPFCRLDTRFRTLRSEPRYRAILAKLGLNSD